jgi:predicted  nucleic acid-binding Zn-ribbon protein
MTAHCSKINPDYHTLGKIDPEFALAQARLIAAASTIDPAFKEVKATREELRAAYQRIAQLEADLLECREYLEEHVDVVDGDYGEPAPNRAMQLVGMIDESIHGPGGF